MDIDQVKKLYYEEKLTAREVGLRLNKSVWQVIKFMKKHNIPRRKSSDSMRCSFDRKPLSYQKRQSMNVFEEKLYLAGLMLYWAEGTKTAGLTVDFANSDPKMVELFLRMLRKIYQVDESRLRVLIYCYSNQDVNVLTLFWQGRLQIHRNQFIKPYIKQAGSKLKRNKMKYGLAHVRYNDKKLFAQIHQDIAIIANGLLK